MLKVEGKHLIFKASIVEVKIYLLIDNESEIKLIDKFLVYTNKISFFRLKKLLYLHIKTVKLSSNLLKRYLLK